MEACLLGGASVVFHPVPLCALFILIHSYKETSHIGLGFTWTFFYHNYLFKVLFSNSHILRELLVSCGGMQFIPQELLRSCFEEDFRLSGYLGEKCFGPSTTILAESRERKLGMRILFVPMFPLYYGPKAWLFWYNLINKLQPSLCSTSPFCTLCLMTYFNFWFATIVEHGNSTLWSHFPSRWLMLIQPTGFSLSKLPLNSGDLSALEEILKMNHSLQNSLKSISCQQEIWNGFRNEFPIVP